MNTFQSLMFFIQKFKVTIYWVGGNTKLWKLVSAPELKIATFFVKILTCDFTQLRVYISQFWLFYLRIAWYKVTIVSNKVRIA